MFDALASAPFGALASAPFGALASAPFEALASAPLWAQLLVTGSVQLPALHWDTPACCC